MSSSENLNWQKLHWGRGGITVFMSLVETGILEVVWLPHWWVLIQPDSARFQWDNGSHCCHPSLKNLKALLASLPWWEYQDHCPTFYSSLCDIAKLVDTTPPPPPGISSICQPVVILIGQHLGQPEAFASYWLSRGHRRKGWLTLIVSWTISTRGQQLISINPEKL